MLPAQKRPCGSARPSLKRWCAGSYGALATLRLSLPPGSTNHMPSRRAATNPPPSRNAKQPIASGNGHATFCAECGSKQLSDGPLMSTQYSNCSSTDHVGHSPRLDLMSSTHSNDDCIIDTRRENAHRTRKPTRRKRGSALGLGGVDRLAQRAQALLRAADLPRQIGSA